MGLKYSKINFSQIEDDKHLRFDSKYHRFVSSYKWNVFNIHNNFVNLSDIIYESYENFTFDDGLDYKGITTGQECIDMDGDVLSHQIVTLDNCPNRLKYKINSSNILLSSIRLAKSPALNFNKLEDVDNYVFSNGYHVFNTQDEWNVRFVMYLLRLNRIRSVINNHIYRGIGISSYRSEDLLKLIIPIVCQDVQCKSIDKIEHIEKRITKLKYCVKSEKDIINKVFYENLKINPKKISEIDKKKYINISSSDIDSRNCNLRSSSRWYKLQLLQTEIFSNISNYENLGDLMIDEGTRNGWSPECSEFDGNYKVLGIDAICNSGVMKLENPKFTDQTRNNISDFIIRNGDFFVSRGNTTDLVALASIAQNIEEDDEYIYPDLMIRVEVDQNRVNKEYLAYLFNSVIGRMYFKYAAKGKQQSMVKVSAEEIKQFCIPMFSLNKQMQLVDEIKTEIKKQDKKKKIIARLREDIDDIIYDALGVDNKSKFKHY